MIDDSRPNPDELLNALRQSDKTERSGKLSIFFGMAAGAGKTYAMLETAQRRLKEGIDVVIGLVETHGRVETETLIKGLPVIPRKKLVYRDTMIEELDLDAILERRSALVLVDELAHTNAPGSRHAKRWQDVLELLDAGIDVYTTLNVQHLESRKESVEAVTGVMIRETVPDSMLERAAHIELIDITPEDLLTRLHDGKVYLGDMAERAAQNFFKDDRLTALREMALRITAEKVENDLRTLLALRGRVSAWRSTERIMVAISHSPTSENLIRTTRRIAFSLDAPWIAVHVDTGAPLSDEDKTQLLKNMTLVRELGGEIVSTVGPDIADALKRTAHQRGITQIVFGRSTRGWLKRLFSAGTPLDRLVSESGSFDVLILRQETSIKRTERFWQRLELESGLLSYWYLIWIITAVSIFNGMLNPLIGYKAVGFIFLLSILIISLFVSLGPILLAAVLSALIWDYFFIPPRGTFHINQPEDIIMGLAYLVVAMVTGTLTHKIRRREKMLRQREERTQALYEIVKVIASETDKNKLVREVSDRIGLILNADCTALLADAEGSLKPVDVLGGPLVFGEQEIAVAKYTFNNKKPAGWSTDTLSSSDSLYLPLIGTSNIVGVFVFRPKGRAKLLFEESNFLNTVCRQLAIGIERELLSEQSQTARRLQESERLHQTILNSISHEIRTPLTAIMGAASALQDDEIGQSAQSRHELASELTEASERLNLVVENLLDTSRLGSGMLRLKREWCDPKDIISVCLEKMMGRSEKHLIKIDMPEAVPLISVDFHLIEQVLANLLRNSIAVSPKEIPIIITVKCSTDSLNIIVSDKGPGIPEESIPHIFERFYRVPGSPSGGVGLGLWLAKNIIDMHEGKIAARNNPDGGAVFSIQLPLEKQPEVPSES